MPNNSNVTNGHPVATATRLTRGLSYADPSQLVINGNLGGVYRHDPLHLI